MSSLFDVDECSPYFAGYSSRRDLWEPKLMALLASLALFEDFGLANSALMATLKPLFPFLS